jgi:hypothetical protein
MMQLVKCPHCQEFCDVEQSTLGQVVGCPICGEPFLAQLVTATRASRKLTPEIPLVYPVQGKTSPAEDEHFRSEPTGLLWAFALLPILIPMLWMVGLFGFKLVPIFSFALPMAMALALCGVNIGLICSVGWSSSTKIKAIAMVSLLGWFSAASIFFLKKEWAEVFKNELGPSNLVWQEYEPSDKAYRIKLPGRAQEALSPLADWESKAVRTTIEGRRAKSVLGAIYTAAHGPNRNDWKGLPDEDCFAKVKTQLAELGEVGGEKAILIPHLATNREHPGREWIVALPDGVTNRVVRVYRVRHRGEDLLYYLSVEGAFVTPEAKYVQDFLKAFSVWPPSKK